MPLLLVRGGWGGGKREMVVGPLVLIEPLVMGCRHGAPARDASTPGHELP